MSEEQYFDDFDSDHSFSYGTDGDVEPPDEASFDAEIATTSSPATTIPTLYKILDKTALERIENDAIDQVTGILGCNVATTRALLIFFSWDVEAVLGNLAERGEDDVYTKAGLITRSDIPPTIIDSATSTISCMVCMSDISPSESSCCSCGHAFCNDCWKQHLTIAINEGQGRSLRCMAPGCGVICEEEMVKKVLNSDSSDAAVLLEKYSKALLESYVEDNKTVKWCPSVPHCGNAVKAIKEVHCEVSCPCGEQFCFNCLQQPHSPATCTMLKEWLKKIQEGSETLTWHSANTKECPKCSKPVEKNGGCNLVVCRCGQAFCWLCGQATGRAHTWSNIEGHSCGAYKDEAENRASEAEKNLKRYLHYLTRYEAHLQSLRFEHRARDDLEEKVEEMIEKETTLSDYGWLHDALEQLFLARKILSFSYIFAYYMFGSEMFANEISDSQNGINKALFEDKQGQLEVEVEKLAKLVELPAVEVAQQRMAIINLSTSINTRIVRMYEVIENDIAMQLAGCSLDVAPYRGQRTQVPVTASGGLSFHGMGVGNSGTGQGSKVVEVIDLTSVDDGEEEKRKPRKLAKRHG